MKILQIVVFVVVGWTLLCLLLAGLRFCWRRIRHREPVDFWKDFWWLWLEMLNPLNWL